MKEEQHGDQRWPSSSLHAWARGGREPRDEHDKRQEADAEVFAQLKAEGFAGANWEIFANEVARYGLAVIRGWLRDGRILTKCREKGLGAPVLPERATADAETLLSIADDIVTLALAKYRDDVLASGRWEPRRGASLKTFFVGQCLIQYANVARGWLREQNKPHPLPVGDAELAPFTSTRLDPATEDVIRDVAEIALRKGAPNHRAAMVIALDSVGYSRAAIADELNISHDSAASILKRERARLRATMTHPRRQDTG